MKNLSRPAWLALSTSVLALGALPATTVAQQSGADEAVEEVVTIGTRRQGRTALDTAVPIDVFNQEELDSVASDDMIDIVRTLVPSFNVSRQPISDGASFIRPPQLRGLDSDKTLVLVNGKRRHRASLVVLGGFGSHGPDLATIPGIAIKSVEVLRDGASAQYGSDAIAGVLNFNLKDEAEGGEVRVQASRYTQDTKDSGYLGALNFGFGIGNNGFVNTSIEISDNEPTSRGVPYDIGIGSSGLTPSQSAEVEGVFDIQDVNGNVVFPGQTRYGPDAVTQVYAADGTLLTVLQGSDGIPDDIDTRYRDNICFAEVGQGNCLTQVWGDPDRNAIRSFVNAGLDLNNSTQLYGWANYSDSSSNTGFFHRRPGVSQLLQLRRPDGSIYDPRDRYPSGFTPRFAGNVIDYSALGGVRGEWENGFSYDFSGRFGHNEIRYEMYNTLNPSMGPASPTRFRPGNLVNEETEFNADFSRGFDIGWANDLNIAFGLAYRDESYDIEEGNEASYRIGPYAQSDPWNFNVNAAEAAAGDPRGVGCYIPGQETPGVECNAGDPIFNVVPVGSNGFPGYGADFTSSYSRSSYAAYVDFETDLTDNFLINLAARFEDYDDFGNELTYKLAGRYIINDAFAIRGSVGTGFRAPTGGQISTVNVSTRIADDGSPVAEGIFPSNGPIAGAFGFQPLDAETSTQATLGITANPTDSLTLTLDAYYIEMKDRIVLSSQFTVGPAELAILQAANVPGAETIAQVRFFTNDVDTETLGLDLVVGYNWDWSLGNSSLNVAANWNQTEITDPGQFLNEESVFDEEEGLPNTRANLTFRHTWENDITFTMRGNYFGSYKNAQDASLDFIQDYGALAQVDFDVTWNISDRYRVTVGGNNVFDELPDADQTNESCCGRVVRSDSVQDWQGPQYYVRGQINW